jgi:hypothetical protein
VKNLDLSSIADLIGALATAFGVYVAWVGVSVWRRQHTWGIRYQAASAMLASAQALKGAILAGQASYETWYRTMGPDGDPAIKAVADRFSNGTEDSQLAASARELLAKRQEFEAAAGHITLKSGSRKPADQLLQVAWTTWRVLDIAATSESTAWIVAPSDPGHAEEVRRQVPAKVEKELGPLAASWREASVQANAAMEAVENALRPFIVWDD